MAAALTPPTGHVDSERVRRRRDRLARLATDRALTEVAFELRAHDVRPPALPPGARAIASQCPQRVTEACGRRS
jgi:hypothetical protein